MPSAACATRGGCQSPGLDSQVLRAGSCETQAGGDKLHLLEPRRASQRRRCQWRCGVCRLFPGQGRGGGRQEQARGGLGSASQLCPQFCGAGLWGHSSSWWSRQGCWQEERGGSRWDVSQRWAEEFRDAKIRRARQRRFWRDGGCALLELKWKSELD